MGSASSVASRSGGNTLSVLAELERECQKPLDSSDVEDFDACKGELTALRSKLRSIFSDTRVFDFAEEVLIKEGINDLLDIARRVECDFTPFLQEIVDKFGGQLVDLKFRFKGRESLERKIRGNIESKKRSLLRDGIKAIGDIYSMIFEIGDALRYTMLIPDQHYCAGVLQARKEIINRGFSARKLKNYWAKGDMYQGINDMYCSSQHDGFLFEVQFHTPASWELKAECHIIYEKFRVSKDPLQMQALFEEGTQLANKLPIPDGVEQIDFLVCNPEPDLLSVYSQLVREMFLLHQEFLENWFRRLCPQCSISLEIDDERIIESELSTLVESLNKPIEDVVVEDYFYGALVCVVVPNESEYVDIVRHIYECMTQDQQNPICARGIVNKWSCDNAGKCLIISACLGSRQTRSPMDNVLFEVAIHTEDSFKLDQILKRQTFTHIREQPNVSENSSQKQLKDVWLNCRVPSGVEKFVRDLGLH